jgi:predicted ATPase
MILERAEQQPMMFIIEDLHWVDASTLEFLTLLLDQGPTALCVWNSAPCGS